VVSSLEIVDWFKGTEVSFKVTTVVASPEMADSVTGTMVSLPEIVDSFMESEVSSPEKVDSLSGTVVSLMAVVDLFKATVVSSPEMVDLLK
jgi:hypothetical protein